MWIFLLFCVFVGVCGGLMTALQDLQSSTEWWMIRNTSYANLYYQMEHTFIFLRHLNLDSHNIHSCYEYKVYDVNKQSVIRSRTFCHPAIVINGYKKCSTSALFMLLAEHPIVVSNVKESCAVNRAIVNYFDTFPEEVAHGKIVVNGCIYWDPNFMIHDILRHPNTFYIMIYRNYADYLWSAYNYWCSYPYDVNCTREGQWVEVGNFTRSPEIFHDLVEASSRNQSVLTPSYMTDSCNVGRQLFTNYTLSVWRSGVKPENTLLLSSEDMEQNANQTWHLIANSFGIVNTHTKLTQFRKFKYNVNGAKGDNKATVASKVVEGVYEVSGYRPMLNKTRVILNKCWHDDCLFTSKVTQHAYPTCRDVNSVVSYTSDDSKLIETYLSTRLNSAFVRKHAFSKTKINQCHAFTNQLHHTRRISSVFGSTSPSVSEKVLLLSTSLMRLTVAKFLTLFLTSDIPMHTMELHNKHETVQQVQQKLCASLEGLVIVTADPRDIATVKGDVGKFRFVNQTVECSLEFSKVIVLLDTENDHLLLAWKLFRAKYVNESLESLWPLWKQNLSEHLLALDTDHRYFVGRSYWWSDELSRAINVMPSTDRLLLPLRDVRNERFSNYENTLKKSFAFFFRNARFEASVHPSMTIHKLPMPNKIASHESIDPLYCAHRVVLDSHPERDKEVVRHSWKETIVAENEALRILYSTNLFACTAERVLAGRVLELATLRRPVGRAISFCDLKSPEIEMPKVIHVIHFKNQSFVLKSSSAV